MSLAFNSRDNQRGGVLLVSLVFLIVIGLLGLSSLTTSRLELRMANNEEVRTNALQTAMALAEAVVATPAMTPVFGSLGYTMCTPGQPNCDNPSLFMPDPALAPEVESGHLNATVVLRTMPNSPPPRGLGFSADKFSAAGFELTSNFDRADEGLGSATVTQGLLVLIGTN
jgi:hypothetical protein